MAVLGRCGLGVLRPGIKDGQRGAEGPGAGRGRRFGIGSPREGISKDDWWFTTCCEGSVIRLD